MQVICSILVLMVWGLAAGSAQAQLRGQVYVSGFTSPLAFVQDPTNRRVQFVVQQGGRIRVVQDGVILATDFLNLTSQVTPGGGERGLLGLAFAPDYATSRRFFVNFTNAQGNTVVARFLRSTNPLVADANSRRNLVFGQQAFIQQPAGRSNHKGGHLAFGADGFLYIGMGDGGAGNNPDHLAQNPSSLLGKMLRIDVSVPDSDAKGYRIPSGNPFTGANPALDEIWAFGYRNPWRFNFDDVAHGGTGAMVVGDVGQSAWEEIDYEPRNAGGRNYGWRNREGAHNNVTSLPLAFTPATDPIFEYGRTDGSSTTGGFVYRGTVLSSFYHGRYFFADFVAGRVWSIALTIDGAGEATASDRRDHTAELGGASILGNISSFGVDTDGELYVVNYTGSIVKITIPSVTPATPTGLRIVQ